MLSPHDISDLEFYILHSTPWTDKLSPVYVKNAPIEVFDEVPVLRQIKRFLEIIEENGGKIKLTAMGNLPRFVVKELYEIGVHIDIYDKLGKSVDTEKNAPNVTSVKFLMTLTGLIRKQKNALYAVKKNAGLVSDPRKLLEKLLYTYTMDYDIGYFDRYDNKEVTEISFESGLIYLLIAKYGDIWRDIRFYRNELQAIHPRLADFDPTLLANCMDCRVFRRQMVELGLLERIDKDWVNKIEPKVRRTPLFDKLIGVRSPEAPILFHSGSIMS